MRIRLRMVFVGAAVLAALAVRASAHHSFAAEFDATKPIALKGTITRVERINPHGWIHIDVKQPDGSVVSWAIETGAPAALARQGIKKTSLPIGVEVIVKGYRAKDGSATANGNIITLPDGTDLSLASSLSNSKPESEAR